jgi:hypothetical protein
VIFVTYYSIELLYFYFEVLILQILLSFSQCQNLKYILPQEKRQKKNDKIAKKGYKNGKKKIQCGI